MNKNQYKCLLSLRESQEFMFKELLKENLKRGYTVRETIKNTTINPKRAIYLLEKFTDRNEYEYGVSIDLGWFNDAT